MSPEPPAPAPLSLSPLREQLIEGLPPRVRGIADAVLSRWEEAVAAVPELARVASGEMIGLLRMEPAERERTLRRRWALLTGDEVEIPVELRGIPVRRVRLRADGTP